jgi:hypothetical protein
MARKLSGISFAGLASKAYGLLSLINTLLTHKGATQHAA